MTNPEREKIATKIRALLNVTIDNGATEHEALFAAEKADALMLEYDLSSIDLKDPEENYGKRGKRFAGGSYKRRAYHPSENCIQSIAAFCDSKAWYSGFDLVYFGTDQNTEFAWYLTEMIRNAMETEYRAVEPKLKKEAADNGYRVHGKTLRTSFMLGMAHRVSSRLRELKRARDVQVNDVSLVKTGTALTVVRNAVLEQKYKELGMKLSSRPTTNKNIHGSSYRSGQNAGDNVNLGRPVTSGDALQIGGH